MREFSPDAPSLDVTQLLHRLKLGDNSAASLLYARIYKDLQKQARGLLRLERENHTLQTSDLVHEAFLRLVREQGRDWESRSHFFAVAARVMRRILVDYARARTSKKRDSRQVSPPGAADLFTRAELLLDMNRLLDDLAKIDARQAEVVEMKYFGGFTDEEVAEFLSVSSRTVKREWKVARIWLLAAFAKERPEIGSGPAPL